MATLGSIFESFVEAVNQKRLAELGRFVESRITYNGQKLGLQEYRSSLLQAREPFLVHSKTIDVLVEDPKKNQVAARLIVTALDRSRPKNDDGPANLTKYPQHIIVTFTPSSTATGKMAEVMSLEDPSAAQPHVSLSPVPRQGLSGASDLSRIYAAYIGCINRRTMTTQLAEYCFPTVIWCGRELPLETYRGLMEEALDSVRGLVFEVRRVVADDERGVLAARIEFEGTPVKRFAGVEPTGAKVSFAEHVFYWFEAGKITRVETVIDWESYKKQMVCSGLPTGGEHC